MAIEIPFERKPPLGFFEVSCQASIKQLQFLTTIEELKGKRRVDIEAQLRIG